MVITQKFLEELLVDRWKYRPTQSASTAQKFLSMDQELLKAFEEYLQSEQFPLNPRYYGLSPKVISENYSFKPPAVFLCLDWIRRDPQNALDALVDEYKKPLPEAFDPAQLREYLDKSKKA